MPRSSRRRRRRRRLARAACIAVLLPAALWALASERSPLARALLRGALRRGARDLPGVEMHLEGGGLVLPFNRAAVSGFRCSASDFASGDIHRLQVRYRLLPLAIGRVALETIALEGLGIKVDARKPVPAAFRSDEPFCLPPFFDLEHIPAVTVSNISVTTLLSSASNAPPSTLSVRGAEVTLRAAPEPDAALPVVFSTRAVLRIDEGGEATIELRGRTSPAVLQGQPPDADIDLAMRGIDLLSLNNLLAPVAPFLAETGTLDMFFAARIRRGKLSGLASFVTHDFSIARNDTVAGSRFLQLSFDMWQFLVRERSGRIELSCDIGGTVQAPHVPVGATLADQAAASGRNLAARVLQKIPVAAIRSIGRNVEAHAADEERYDDILKITRLPPEERHYERARHYERVVRNDDLALAEYARQVEAFPGTADLNVRALRAMAEIHLRRHKDTPAALRTLRRIVDTFHDHAEADDAMWRMIELAVDTRDYPRAGDLCDEFVTLFPHSALLGKVRDCRRNIERYIW